MYGWVSIMDQDLATLAFRELAPDKAMKRISLPVSYFACVEEAPATVGRLWQR